MSAHFWMRLSWIAYKGSTGMWDSMGPGQVQFKRRIPLQHRAIGMCLGYQSSKPCPVKNALCCSTTDAKSVWGALRYTDNLRQQFAVYVGNKSILGRHIYSPSRCTFRPKSYLLLSPNVWEARRHITMHREFSSAIYRRFSTLSRHIYSPSTWDVWPNHTGCYPQTCDKH